MTYREDHYAPTGTHSHPVGAHAPSGGSAWGLAVVLVVLLGLLGLAMIVGPSDQRSDTGAPATTAPMIEQQAPAAPAPAE